MLLLKNVQELAVAADIHQMNLFTAQGRVGRLGYLATHIGAWLAIMLALSGLVDGDPDDPNFAPSATAVMVLVLGMWVIVANEIRRLRDLGHGCYWVFLFFVPVVNMLLIFYLLFAPGIARSRRHRRRSTSASRPDPEAVMAQRARLDAYHEQLLNPDGTFNREGLFGSSDLRRE